MKLNADAFYISAVTDERIDKKNIGRLIPVSANAVKTEAVSVPLQGGGLTAVESYVKKNLPLKYGLRPVVARMQKMFINEVAMPDGRVDGKVELSIAFDLQTGEDIYVHLVNYTGGAHYIRTSTQANVAEPALRNAIENAMAYINNWINKQEDGNPLLAREVKLVFTDYIEQPETDTIYYSPKRPLIWDDFKDRPRNGRFTAEVMPGLGYAEQTSINKGVIYVNLAMKVYLPKSASWVNPSSQTSYALNHEQRHFDIVKLGSERFKKRMLKEKLPVLNYDGYINVEYFEALREIERLQKQYDDETAHGTNTSEQERWNRLIDKELSSINS
ncbi:hypothetical protein [Mucilaginibacter agri]|uniref:DUF922 domain-containing protein n=1 Tax=Mucilaginibacter agri TaxID=2695265 RepID=A0A965ZCT3_9SPHI|nr:hypothetical protein [Mucilaginibacter agri]NCD67918.1 hypothetical protein [Mucilaginibacter agri]